MYKNITKFTIDWKKESKSKNQTKVKQFLRPHWEGNVCFEEMVLAGTRLSLDLVNLTKKIAVEVHGRQHEQFVPFFHKTKLDFADQIKRDEDKKKWCINNKIHLIEVYEDDIPKLSEKWFEDKGIIL